MEKNKVILPISIIIGCVIIGGGLTKSKLSLPGKALAEIPNTIIIEGLSNIVE